ncbi:hypothetical protein DYBT9275_05952 [Dyadobacter sp. CECT 9275]|uniref:Alpha-L-rhamnosidase six-hairpin glycosidase domain-containing protein n=1 Tax=Dyadobacter helix TaxID=2822344 RepID=A0A916JJV0_9BACT|nr:hypothetical protein [Dyadobacter sp. CECT 9275]CAG5018192.1 hypothetical protein DYBT9275_05952 [Dyadobacter sp. CECT 9275]
MKFRITLFWGYLALCHVAAGQSIISKEDFEFLQNLTSAVLDSSRIMPRQSLPSPFGRNNTGGTLIRPGGRSTYPAFWIRDYAMSLETGMVTPQEQKHMLLLTASTQCDQTWITQNGSMVPFGAVADHIRVDDSRPIYFPGTYDYEAQGTKEYGMMPPYCDQFYFIQMAYYYLQSNPDIGLFRKKINNIPLISRLENAFQVPPSHADNQIVYTTAAFRGVDFGFRDAIEITGDLCYASILKYIAAEQLAVIFRKMNEKSKADYYQKVAASIKQAIPRIFFNANGMLRASTGKSAQPDVWATALAVYAGVLEGDNLTRACKYLSSAYKAGTLAYKGSIRHILTNEDFDSTTAWESALVKKNSYQNGAYWGTPTGWVAYAIGKADPASAVKLVHEYIGELRENDFRKGAPFSSPVECFSPSGSQGPVYLTTVSCPYSVFKKHLVSSKK